MSGSSSFPSFHQGIVGSTTLQSIFSTYRAVRVDANGRLEVVIPPGVPLGVDVQQYASVAVISAGTPGAFAMGGTAADDALPTANPVLMGGIYLNPQTALTAPGNFGHLLLDEFRRLRITGQLESRDPWGTPGIAPVAVGGYADVTYTAPPAPDGAVMRFITNASGWQRIEAYGPTLDTAVPVVAANYPVPISGLYTAAPAAVLVDGAQGTIAVDARRMLRIVGGDNADDSANAGTWPVVIGGRAAADPTLSTLSAAGDIAYALFDLNRYLYTHDKAYDATSLANRVFEVSPLNLQVVEESLVDTTNHAVSAGIQYPSADGIVMMGYKDISLTGKFICGADNTVTLTVQGTNDEDATPANRDWITVYGWRSDTNSVINSIANPVSTTTTFGWDFDEWNYRYFRINLVITNPGPGALSNTVIVKERRKAL